MELTDLDPDPIRQFERWFREAQAISGMEFPDTMALATSTPDGHPSVRMVLYKGLNNDCFTFVTSYGSRKALEIDSNPHAALCFFWDWTGHQVRAEGMVERLPEADSDAYFRTRPRSSQLGAWASPQSQEIGSRQELEDKVRELDERYRHQEVPRPKNWGGYRLRPERIEFWKNGAHRLHDRFEFTRTPAGWLGRRLAP
jgi:pyridoxamine 5'-phosphate oxidase